MYGLFYQCVADGITDAVIDEDDSVGIVFRDQLFACGDGSGSRGRVIHSSAGRSLVSSLAFTAISTPHGLVAKW